MRPVRVAGMQMVKARCAKLSGGTVRRRLQESRTSRESVQECEREEQMCACSSCMSLASVEDRLWLKSCKMATLRCWKK